jgi:pimeloyl-ACP methyl ester carboxylesterase
MHVVQGGRPGGPVIVLLAGFPETWSAWRRTMPALADRHQVIAVDLPGQGHSDRPDGSYDTHVVASRIAAVLAKLGVHRYWLVGHDIGGWVAFSLALTAQDQLLGLALLDAGIPGITLPESIPTDRDRAWKTWHFAFHLVPELPETLLAGRERDYVEWFLRTKAIRPGTFDADQIDHYAAAIAAEGGLRASLAYYRDAAESARRNRDMLAHRRLTVPVLGISGSHGSIPDMAASLAPWVEDVSGVVIPDTGHFIPEEQPSAVVEALLTFITAH